MKAYEGSSSEWEKFSDDEFQPEEVKVYFTNHKATTYKMP